MIYRVYNLFIVSVLFLFMFWLIKNILFNKKKSDNINKNLLNYVFDKFEKKEKNCM